MPQGNSDVSAQVVAELTGAAENVPCTPGQARACTVREVLDRVGGKWSIGILVAASHGPVRFTELERHIEGISRRMLTLTLRNLERDGLLHRQVYPTVPPKVEYTRHPDGPELYESLVALTSWAERHRPAIAEARAAYDREHAGKPAPGGVGERHRSLTDRSGSDRSVRHAGSGMVRRQTRRTHGEILAAAARRFAVTGYKGTSLQDIAREVGCSKATVLYHFAGKEALLAELMAPADRGAVRAGRAARRPHRRRGPAGRRRRASSTSRCGSGARSRCCAASSRSCSRQPAFAHIQLDLRTAARRVGRPLDGEPDARIAALVLLAGIAEGVRASSPTSPTRSCGPPCWPSPSGRS